MGGIAASKGFEYQDLCALYRVVEFYEPGHGQTVQVENNRTPAGKHEPWDFRVVNPAARTGGFTPELWQAKNTSVPKEQCCIYWKNLHKAVHGGKLEIAASADIKIDMLLSIITSSRLQTDQERFRQFLECLRGYDEMPDRHDLEDVWREDYKGVDLDSRVKQLTSEKVNSLSHLDFTSRNNNSVFWLRRFRVEEWTTDLLRERIENLCGRRLGMRLEDLGTGFEKLFGVALSHIRKNCHSF